MTTIRRRPAERRARTVLRAVVATGRAAGAACLFASATAALAQSDGATAGQPGFQFNGFGTVAAVGVDSPDDWGFRRELTQPARRDSGLRFDTDTRLGLQADWRASAQWEFVGQLVLKPRPPEETNQESVTEAFVAWRPSADWTLRLGRTSPDLFLLADSRNVGFSYPWIRPNVEFYGWVPIRQLDGMDVTRQWSLGDARWRAKLFGGRSTVTFADSEDFADRARINQFVGGTLAMDSGAWTLKATVARAKTRPFDEAGLQQARAALDQIAMLPVPAVAQQAAVLRDSFPAGTLVTHYSALSAAWDAAPWQLQAEVSRIDGNFATSRAWYGYASAARRFGEATTVFAMAGVARSSHAAVPEPDWTAALTPIVGPQLAAGAQLAGASVAQSTNGALEDEHSVSLGMRYDLGPQLALKAQVDAVRTARHGGGLWAFSTSAAHHALVGSVGVDFVF